MKNLPVQLTGQEKLALVEKAKAGTLTASESSRLWLTLTRRQRLVVRIKQRAINTLMRRTRKAAGLTK